MPAATTTRPPRHRASGRRAVGGRDTRMGVRPSRTPATATDTRLTPVYWTPAVRTAVIPDAADGQSAGSSDSLQPPLPLPQGRPQRTGLHTMASQSSHECGGWSTPGQVPSKSGTQARSPRIDHPNVSSVVSNGGDNLDLGAFGARVLEELCAFLLGSVGAVARSVPCPFLGAAGPDPAAGATETRRRGLTARGLAELLTRLLGQRIDRLQPIAGGTEPGQLPTAPAQRLPIQDHQWSRESGGR